MQSGIKTHCTFQSYSLRCFYIASGCCECSASWTVPTFEPILCTWLSIKLSDSHTFSILHIYFTIRCSLWILSTGDVIVQEKKSHYQCVTGVTRPPPPPIKIWCRRPCTIQVDAITVAMYTHSTDLHNM